ncbi:MAG TPA: hypothetical protein VEI96_12145, partial [Thermodesulfovibrionales bacterium]|nr:hypothetical protein [Thermodesulfovibrionales bacterium]
MGKIKIKRIVFLSSVLLVLGVLTLIGRGPYISNQLKRLILPELSAATGREVIAEKIYINIFPLTIEVRDLRVFENGEEIIRLPRVKGYIEISGFLDKELIVRRLVIRDAAVRSDESQLTDIIRRVREYLALERKSPIKVVLKTLAVDDGTFTFDYRGNRLTGSGLNGEAILKAPQTIITRKSPSPRITFSVRHLSSRIEGWPEVKGEIKGTVVLRDDAVEIKGVQVGFYGSMVHASGVYAGGRGGLQVRLGLLMESAKKIFGLTQKGEGGVTAKGTVELIANNPLQSTVDMELKGEMYLEALMELLKVKEKVEGLVSFTGNLRGPLNSLAGTAKARLRKGNLFGIDLDALDSTVSYRDGNLIFTGGHASLSHGTADAEATIAISGPPYYSLNVKGYGIDSRTVFKFIGWDPGIPEGKVRGELRTEGEKFAPSGWFDYESIEEGGDVLGRVKKANGSYSLRDDVLSLSGTEISTARSHVSLHGDIDIASSVLSLETEMRTDDISDITSPYLRELTGSGTAGGTVTGKFDNPSLNWTVRLRGASFEGYHFGDAAGDLNYRKDLLEVKDATLGDAARSSESLAVRIRGAIRFPDARELFDVKKPQYALRVSLKNGDLERLSRIVYKKKLDPSPKGMVEADIGISGSGSEPLYEGTLRITELKVGDIFFDSLSTSISYDYKVLSLKDLLLKKGGSTVTADGNISRDETFRFRASGRDVFLKDVAPQRLRADARLSFRAEGKGTLDNPMVEMEGTLKGWKFRNLDVGDGTMSASLKGRTVTVDARFFDEKVTLTGMA